MIHLTRINRVPLVLNSDLIEHVEATPDTVISLTSGQKILVLESPSEIVDRVVQFRRSIAGGLNMSGVNSAGRSVVSELRRVSGDGTHPSTGHRD